MMLFPAFLSASSRSFLFLEGKTFPFKDDTGIFSLDAFLINLTVSFFMELKMPKAGVEPARPFDH